MSIDLILKPYYSRLETFNYFEIYSIYKNPSSFHHII